MSRESSNLSAVNAARLRPRNQLELMLAQLTAIEKWIAAGQPPSAAEAAALTREMRLDLSRRMDARRKEQEALIAHADAQLAASGRVLAQHGSLRAVLAHRNEWLRTALADRLIEHGVQIVGVYGDGAEAAGTLVAEQPDLVLVEDRLPTVSGIEVIRRAREYAPDALVFAHVLDGSSVDQMVAAGALAVFTRRIPPREIADQLMACVSGRELVTLR